MLFINLYLKYNEIKMNNYSLCIQELVYQKQLNSKGDRFIYTFFHAFNRVFFILWIVKLYSVIFYVSSDKFFEPFTFNKYNIYYACLTLLKCLINVNRINIII